MVKEVEMGDKENRKFSNLSYSRRLSKYER